MQDFQQRKKIRKTLYSRNVVLLLGVITILIARGALGVVFKDIESRKNLEVAQAEIAIAQAKNDELSRHIAHLGTEAGIESEIRQKYSVSKEGEEVAVIVNPSATTTTIQKAKEGVWNSFVSWITNIW